MSAEINKPEWFQMAEADGVEPKPKRKRIVRIMALSTPLLVLGAGLVFAQSQESPSAVASVSSVALSPAANAPISITPAAASIPTASAAPVSQNSPASISIKKPGIATMPTGGGEDTARTSDDD